MESDEGEEGRFAAATRRKSSRTEETASSYADLSVERGSGQSVERVEQGEIFVLYFFF